MRSNANRFGRKKGISNYNQNTGPIEQSSMVHRTKRRSIGHSTLNTAMTRGQFGKAVGLGTAGVIGAGLFGSRVVRAQDAQPITEVWPDSDPLDVIDAVDAGGTVYFHSRTPEGVLQPYDLNTYPLTNPTNPLSRFIQIGRLGKDIAIIGLNDGGLVGERPIIKNGGAQQLVTPAKKRGVRMTITNMEFFRPGTGPGSVGATSIFVNNTTGVEITDCKFTVDGASTAQFQYIKFAIWLIFRKDMAYVEDPTNPTIPNPCTGPLIVKDNEFFVNGKNNPGNSTTPGSTGAIGFGCFFDTNVPSYLVDNNYVEADGCGGGFGSMLGGCHGNGSNSTFSNNTVKTKTVDEPSDKVLFLIPSGTLAPFLTTNVKVLHNDFSGAVTTIAQIIVDGSNAVVAETTLSKSIFKNNKFGPVETGGIAAFVNSGDHNDIVYNDFTSCDVPGWFDRYGNPIPGGVGCIYLSQGTRGNYIRGNIFPVINGYQTTICNQIIDYDMNRGNVGGKQGSQDAIPGYGVCQRNPEQAQQVQDALSNQLVPQQTAAQMPYLSALGFYQDENDNYKQKQNRARRAVESRV